MRRPGLARRLIDDAGGLALVEFALVLPILILMFLGSFELSNAIACNRKVVITARAAADLTSQFAELQASRVQTILGASTQIMAPFAASKALVRVSEVTVDNKGKVSVVWSRAINGQPYAAGAAYTLPSNLVIAGTSGLYYIVSDVTYQYTPITGMNFIKPLKLSQTITMLPRVSNAVPCGDCT